MYAKESQHQEVIFTFFEKMALASLELLQKGKKDIRMRSLQTCINWAKVSP